MATNLFKSTYNYGGVSSPDITSGSKMILQGMQTPLDYMAKQEDKKKQAVLDARATELYNRKIAEDDRQLAARDAFKDYASQPLQTSRALDMQRAASDQALIKKYDELNKRAEKDPTFNPALSYEEAKKISDVYDNTTPFREDVENRVKADLVSKGIDPVQAQQYAQGEAKKYESLSEYQSKLDAKATSANKAAKEANDYQWKVAEYLRKVAKDNKPSGSGTGNATEKAIAALGNDKDVTRLYNKAKEAGVNMKEFDKQLALASGYDPSNVMTLDLTDWGKKDINTEGLKNLIAAKSAENKIKLAKGIDPNAAKSNGLPMPGAPAATVRAKDARTEAAAGMLGNMEEALGGLFKPKKVVKEDTTEKPKPPKVTTNDETTTKEDGNAKVEKPAKVTKDTKGSAFTSEGTIQINNMNQLKEALGEGLRSLNSSGVPMPWLDRFIADTKKKGNADTSITYGGNPVPGRPISSDDISTPVSNSIPSETPSTGYSAAGEGNRALDATDAFRSAMDTASTPTSMLGNYLKSKSQHGANLGNRYADDFDTSLLGKFLQNRSDRVSESNREITAKENATMLKSLLNPDVMSLGEKNFIKELLKTEKGRARLAQIQAGLQQVP